MERKSSGEKILAQREAPLHRIEASGTKSIAADLVRRWASMRARLEHRMRFQSTNMNLRPESGEPASRPDWTST
jgi:hypothetical protein